MERAVKFSLESQHLHRDKILAGGVTLRRMYEGLGRGHKEAVGPELNLTDCFFSLLIDTSHTTAHGQTLVLGQ